MSRTQTLFLTARNALDAHKTATLEALAALWAERGTRVDAAVSQSRTRVTADLRRWDEAEAARFARRCAAVRGWGTGYARAVRGGNGGGHDDDDDGDGGADTADLSALGGGGADVDLSIDFDEVIGSSGDADGGGAEALGPRGGEYQIDWSSMGGLDDSEMRRCLSESLNASFSGLVVDNDREDGTGGTGDTSIALAPTANLNDSAMTDMQDLIRPPGSVIEQRVKVHRLAVQGRFREAAVAKALLGRIIAEEARAALMRERERHAEAQQRIKERQREALASLERENEALREAHEAAQEAAFEEVGRKYLRDLRALEDKFQIRIRREQLSPVSAKKPATTPKVVKGERPSSATK
jgi:hypothetical protein